MFGIKKLSENILELKASLMKAAQEINQRLKGLEENLQSGQHGEEENLQSGLKREEENRPDGQKELSEKLRNLEEAVVRLQTDLKHHNMSIEDMLESWEDFQDRNKEQMEKLDRQDQLLNLCFVYEQQLHNIHHMAADDPAWARQLDLVEMQLKPARIKAGLQVIGKAEEAVDYSLHEVISVQETEEPEKNGLIESVYEPGFCWQGNILKKARVGAYRFHD